MSDPYEREAAKAAINTLQRELAAAKQIMGELCESCGWAMRLPDQPCRCELERELAEARGVLVYEQGGIHATACGWAAKHAEAIEQRDTLAEACRKLMKIVGAPGTNEWHETKECDAAYLAGKKALAAVKGRKP
jgi:hypothetical protein